MMAPVPLPTANGRCGLGEGTFATTRGKGRDAPTTVIRRAASNRPVSHHPEQTSIAWSDPSSVSIRIPRSPYAALFLFTARQRSDVLTQEWRAAATAAPFVELSRQSRDRPQARRSCARVSASSNPPPGILTGLVDSCSMPGPSSEIAAIR
jgi:hypothetical protein